MPGARAPAFHSLQIEVPCIGPVPPECGAYILQELLKHFLYMRRQLPVTFDQLFWHYQATMSDGEQGGQESDVETDLCDQRPHKKPRLSSTQRKLNKTITATQALLEHLSPQLLSTQKKWWISFLFGPSPQRPHESYDVRLSIKGEGGDAFQEVQGQRMAKKILRSLVVMSSDVPEGKASKGSTKVFVMIRCPSMTEAPPGFLPKRGFQLNSKRGLQVVMDLSDSQSLRDGGEGAATLLDSMQLADTPVGEASPDRSRGKLQQRQRPEEEVGGVEMVWYQCRQSVAGYSNTLPVEDGL